MLCRVLWDTSITAPPRVKHHLRRWGRKMVRVISQRRRAKPYLLDSSEWVNSWIHGNCGGLHRTYMRSIWLIVQQRGRGETTSLYPNGRAIDSWWLLGVGQSGFLRCVVPGKLTMAQWWAPNPRVCRQHKLDLIGYFKIKEKRTWNWETALKWTHEIQGGAEGEYD